MFYAEKMNRVLQIPDEKKEEYIRMGYSISTMDGKIVYEHMNQEQKLKFTESENEKLKAENEKLKAENGALKEAASKQEVSGEEESGGKKTPKAGKKTE